MRRFNPSNGAVFRQGVCSKAEPAMFPSRMGRTENSVGWMKQSRTYHVLLADELE